MKSKLAPGTTSTGRPLLAKFDATRDMKGTFYVVGELETQFNVLKTVLERRFQTKLCANANTHQSCLQFDEWPAETTYFRRFKVYNKVLQLLQSVAPQKAVGINTNAIYNPQQRMLKALVEAANEGVTRLEISYQFRTEAALTAFFNNSFGSRLESDLQQF